jgi:hypothetical protein
VSERDHDAILDAMAALHAAFWLDPALEEPDLGLCTPARLFTHASAANLEQVAAQHPIAILGYLQDGWARVPDVLDDDVAVLLDALSLDPSPLCVALEAFEWTLVHGDLRMDNLGLRYDGDVPTLIALDMARPVRTAPVIDLAWYLALTSHRLPVAKEETIAAYRRHLERRLGSSFADATWQRQVELGLLGGLLMTAPIKAARATIGANRELREFERRELTWWSHRAREGARHLARRSK